MTRNVFIANRLREVLLDGYWIANTNYKAQLESITWEQAVQKVGNLNSIAALTFHINYYMEGILDVVNGGNLDIHDQYSFEVGDMQSDEDWQNLVNRFLKNAEAFCKQVAILPDYRLDQTFVDEKYGTYLRNLEGVIEHSYYHLGQISLIKKLIVHDFHGTTKSLL
jgi:uncharacterized damage-inducible protein DinB